MSSISLSSWLGRWFSSDFDRYKRDLLFKSCNWSHGVVLTSCRQHEQQVALRILAVAKSNLKIFTRKFGIGTEDSIYIDQEFLNAAVKKLTQKPFRLMVLVTDANAETAKTHPLVQRLEEAGFVISDRDASKSVLEIRVTQPENDYFVVSDSKNIRLRLDPDLGPDDVNKPRLMGQAAFGLDEVGKQYDSKFSELWGKATPILRLQQP